MNSIQKVDIRNFAHDFPFSKELANKNVLITGGTGLIGSTIVKCLQGLNLNTRITIPVRNSEKAFQLFGESLSGLTIIPCDLEDYLSDIGDSFNFIFHCASPTSGTFMTSHPVETFELAINTTRSLLRYVKDHLECRLLYVSSLEVYGEWKEDNLITEEHIGYVDPFSARSSYPLGKRAAEYLCLSYAKEYNVPVMIARLTQTLGPGVSAEDNRVFVQFVRSIVNNKDIILHTKGESAKPYCYTADCVMALFYILFCGGKGQVYNVANQDSYISIIDLAKLLRDSFNPAINIRIEPDPNMSYAPPTRLHLSSKKLMSLGWKPKYDLIEMFERFIQYYKYEINH